MPSKKEVKELLDFLDKNKDGKISVDELHEFMKESTCTLDKKKVEQFIKLHDKDGDGKLDLDELCQCLSE